uniref:Peptidase S1 domain-containing protein n=1 Tax=Glossina brevipalpis TaxID=37001 RepID=A0A1A9X5G5_9MUSC
MRTNLLLLLVIKICLSFTIVTTLSANYRIINGATVSWPHARYQVSVRWEHLDWTYGWGHKCGGALIGSNVVLTAAHCVWSNFQDEPFYPEDVRVVLGNINRYVVDENTLILGVEDIIVGSNFHSKRLTDDIAVLVLNETVPDDFKAAAIIEMNDKTEVAAGTKCIVTGWGLINNKTYPEQLQFIEVPIIDKGRCLELYGGKVFKEGMLCAGYITGEKDACTGDSGGPLVCDNKLVGIVSSGLGCAKSGYPGIYTDVAFYMQRVINALKDHDVENDFSKLLNGSVNSANDISTIGADQSLSKFTYQESKIINGSTAEWNNTQHHVSLRNRLKDSYFFGTGHLCGGSLISNNMVLCAAHCFTDQKAFDGSYLPADQFIIVMGNLDRFEENENTLTYDIKKVVTFAEIFNFTSYDNDIALAILNDSVPVNHPTIQIVTLNDAILPGDTMCEIFGWGETEEGSLSVVLMTLNVPIIEAEICRDKTTYGNKILDGMLCAGYLEGERDACKGDSGGSLLCNGVQAGIISWGDGCAKPYSPGVYANVAYYKDWILEQGKVHNGTLPTFVNGNIGAVNNSTNGTNVAVANFSLSNSILVIIIFFILNILCITPHFLS